MTPKEKAKDLVDKFYQTTPNEAWINEPLGISEEYKAWKQAKQCALVTVNEIIESREDDSAFDDTMWENASEYYSPHPMYLNYWIKVKIEINKL